MEYLAHEAAEKLGITVATLHYYEKEGLLPPIKRNDANTRAYTEVDIEWLYMIVLMRETGVPIREIRQYTGLLRQGPDTAAQRYELVKAYKESVEEKIKLLESSLVWLNAKVEFYGEMLAGDVTCHTFAEEATAFRKRIGVKNIFNGKGE